MNMLFIVSGFTLKYSKPRRTKYKLLRTQPEQETGIKGDIMVIVTRRGATTTRGGAGMMEQRGRGRVEGKDFGKRNLKLQKGSLPRKSKRNSIES